MLSAILKPLYWRVRYARWPAELTDRVRDGYTVLVPVPGDIPLLLDLALRVVRTLDDTHRLETIVIPDMPSRSAQQVVDSFIPTWPGSLRLVNLARIERAVLPRLNNPGKNHPAQLIRGTAETDASHVIFHDADLFPFDVSLHERTWQACRAGQIDVCGIEESWDPWYSQHDRELVATWEMCCRTSWLRRFPPWRHFAHETESQFGTHVFDTTFWPQFMTAQNRVACLDSHGSVFHFNYLISTYRNFQRASAPFHDGSFRLLLLRLLHDALGLHDDAIPSLRDLERGLSCRTGEVYYLPEDALQLDFMVTSLVRVCEGPWFDIDQELLHERLGPFEVWARATVSRPGIPGLETELQAD